jgi:ribosomal protein S18 acetylase RimI-like enzyme
MTSAGIPVGYAVKQDFTLRPANLRDLPRIVAAHQVAFPGFFLTMLGPRFLGELYAGFLTAGSSICYVADDRGECLGFVVGTTEPAGFFKRLLARRWHAFLYAGLSRLMRHPVSVSQRFLAALFFRGDLTAVITDATLLSSLAVHPPAKGKGIGLALVEKFCAEAVARGSNYVYLMTDEDNNHRVNCFYRKCGFSLDGSSRRISGRVMNRYLRSAALSTKTGA